VNEVVVHPGIVDRFFRDSQGPVGRYLFRRGERVARAANANASGPVLGVITGDLLANFDAGLDVTSEGLYYFAGTTAVHGEFGYPAFHDREATGGKRWLTSALAEEFS